MLQIQDKMSTIDTVELTSAIAETENSGPYPTKARFFVKLCESQWGRSVGLKPYTAHIRVKELGIGVNLNKVPSVKSVPLLPLYEDNKKSILELAKATYCGQPSTDTSLKVIENPNKAHYDRMRKEFPAKYQTVIDKAQGGSLKALIILNCAQCAGFSMTSIKKCTVHSCPMWVARPFQDKNPVVL